MIDLSVLVLSYGKGYETDQCLISIKNFVQVPHKTILLANGNTHQTDDLYLMWPTYATDKYWDINTIILNQKNNGCGYGTSQLFHTADTKYCITIQNDCLFSSYYTPELHAYLIEQLENGVFCIDLAGNQGQGKYSERAVLWKRERWLAIEDMPNGGPGPFAHLKWNEEHIQDYIKDNGLNYCSLEQRLVADNGKYTVRENPDGSVWKQRTDTKELRLLKGPVTSTNIYPSLTESEWSLVMGNPWPDWQIPSKELHASIAIWGHYENPKNERKVINQ